MGIKRRMLRDSMHSEGSKKRLASVDRGLRKNIISALLAMSVTALPFVTAEAAGTSSIVKYDGTSVNAVNNVYKVYADQVSGSIATNRFKEFNLANGNIANMYFHTIKNSTEASTLVNFVQSDINISGTVNALRANKIGGNTLNMKLCKKISGITCI